jgi:hypothetical protein
MPSPEFNIVQSVAKAIQYTGSNSGDITSQLPGVSFVSEVSNVLTVEFNGNPIVLKVTDWIAQNSVYTINLTNNQYLNEWGCVVLCSEMDAIAETLSQVQTQSALGAVRAIGIAPVPTLAASGTANINVQLRPAMPDASYSAYASTFAGISLTDLVINSVTVVDMDTVIVAVENTGLDSLAGATVMVHAVD